MKVKITKNDVLHVAKLAYLRFPENQIDRFTQQLNTILEYFERLQELDTTGVAPLTHAVQLNNAFRGDAVKESLTKEESLQNGPSTERNCFKVPKVIEG
jgi:aspartyl-tRNA(Asn)/glutamyl-tRNA(Gln) amidotransferase subunit C